MVLAIWRITATKCRIVFSWSGRGHLSEVADVRNNHGTAPLVGAVCIMPRPNRIYAPRAIFHITARTQAKAKLFDDEIKTEIARIICEAARMSDTWPIAFTVMSNHLHIIARQGNQPFSWFMQRVLQRTALVVKQRVDCPDHVFGKRYWCGIVDDPFYARQSIIYTHLNAFYAGLCAHPSEYRWSTHAAFSGAVHEWDLSGFCNRGQFLFSDESVDDRSANYNEFVNYWVRRERLPLATKYLFQTDDEQLIAPVARTGDLHWQAEYGCNISVPSGEQRLPIADCAQLLLRMMKHDLSLDQIRTAGRIAALGKVRRELTAGLLARGYRNSAIARCLNVSRSYVSEVHADMLSALHP